MKKTLIERIEVGSGGAASIEFTSIPQTYTDLLVVVSARGDSGNRTNIIIKPNGTSTNTSDRILFGYDSSQVGTGTNASDMNSIMPAVVSTSNVFSNVEIYIPNYAGSAAKSLSADGVAENNSTSDYFLLLTAGLYNSSTAITTLELVPRAGNFVQYSSASLYGVTAGNDGTTTVS